MGVYQSDAETLGRLKKNLADTARRQQIAIDHERDLGGGKLDKLAGMVRDLGELISVEYDEVRPNKGRSNFTLLVGVLASEKFSGSVYMEKVANLIGLSTDFGSFLMLVRIVFARQVTALKLACVYYSAQSKRFGDLKEELERKIQMLERAAANPSA